MKRSILVVAAHPDDETLGCGATIAAHADAGDRVSILILGEGFTSRDSSTRSSAKTLQTLEKLRKDARTAARILGARRIQFASFPDNRFDTVALLDIVKRVELEIQEVRPQVIYTHHPGDLNIDHRLTFEAVLTATRPLGSSVVRELYSFFIASASEWAFGQLGSTFKPTLFVDASSTISRKTRALEAYGSEARAFPHPRSVPNLQAWSRIWGAQVGLRSAEAFETVRQIQDLRKPRH